MKGEIKLSIKRELESLAQSHEDLQKALSVNSSKLDELNKKRIALSKKINLLESRSSSLARKLLAELQAELETILREIKLLEEKKAELIATKKETSSKINDYKSNIAPYIEEQSLLMVSDFLYYLSENLENIALSCINSSTPNTLKVYRVAEVSAYLSDRYGGCYVPTGAVGIYDENSETLITKSSDFYFSNKLYDSNRGVYDNLLCIRTAWYLKYRDCFISRVLELLNEKYLFGDTFELTIQKSGFTLELL